MKVKIGFKAIIGIFFIFLISTGIAACSSSGESIPVYQPIADPPEEVTIEQLLNSYSENDLVKYENKKLLFSGVIVEDINTVFIDSANASTIYPVNNIVEFRPRYRTDTALVREGYIIDVVGELRGVFGVMNPYIIIDDCWIKIIEGDLNVGQYEDPDY
ncbi:MAG: hypothetical protein JSV74_00050 [Dehalococcoidia bacterium]|nr:MAG: hypothetical protein JSV74_00050 [Dehalococcoidia bacterium]